MCYHASVAATYEQLSEEYHKPFEGEFPSFHSPSNIIGYHISGFNFPRLPIITQQSPQHFSFAQWGLIPRWIKTWNEAEQIRLNTLNAKIETLLEKPSFKQASLTQRCLVPMTGFFEWQQTQPKEKQPYFIHLKNQAVFSVAGIAELWVNPNDNLAIQTFSLVTTEANSLMAEIHNTKKRMPLILPKELESLWLNQNMPAVEVLETIKPIEEANMEAYTIAKLIGSNNTNSNSPEVLRRFVEPQTKLF